MSKLVEVEDSLETLKGQHPGAEDEELPTEFSMTSKTKGNLEILEDAPFELAEWEREHKENQWAVRAFKMWFTFYKSYKDLSFVQIPSIFDDNAFIEEALTTLREEIPEGEESIKYITECGTHIDLSVETAFRLEALIQHIGGSDQLNSQGDSTDDNIGAFFMFVIKDYCCQVGLIEEKRLAKASPAWKIQLLKHKMEYFSEKQKYLSQ